MSPVASQSFSDRLDWLLDWLYPPRCRACGGRILSHDADCFCAACWAHVQIVSHPMCTICGRPFPNTSGGDHTCGLCLSRPPQFRRARSWACYPRENVIADPLRQVVQKFKYGRKVSLGKPLGRLMARNCLDFLDGCEIDIIVPVPLHLKRLRWRGFNQSLVLARQVARAYGRPVDPFVLSRHRETSTQTQLNEEERRKNVRGAFNVDPRRPVDKKSVLLVDDVYTSGATVDECSRTLRRAGADKVYVFTLARAVS